MRSRPMHPCLAALAAAVLLVPASAAAAPIFVETFDAEAGSGDGGSGQSGINYTGFASWSVSGGSVDLVAHGDFAPAAGEIACFGGSGKCIDLDGTSNGGVLTSIAITLDPGTYELSYELSGVASSFTQSSSNPSNTVHATVTGGYFFESVTRDKGDPFETFGGQFTVTSSTSVQIVFEDLGADSFGAMLDEVRLESVEEVPEPGTVGLALGGLLALTLGRRRNAR